MQMGLITARLRANRKNNNNIKLIFRYCLFYFSSLDQSTEFCCYVHQEEASAQIKPCKC